MKKLMIAVLCIIMCLAIQIPVFVSAEDSDVTFGVISDPHIKTLASVSTRRYVNALNFLHKEGAEATMVCGDLTNNGLPTQFIDYALAKKSATTGKMPVYEVMGNHDMDFGDEAFNKIIGGEYKIHFTINGYHFIMLTPDDSTSKATYEKSRDWLHDQLEIAAEQGGDSRPIFVFAHHAIKDTVYVSSDWYGYLTEEDFNTYPQVVFFSGHSHSPNNNPMSIWQDGFTCVNVPSLKYFEMETGYGSTKPLQRDKANQVLLVNVSGSKVKVQTFDLNNGKPLAQVWEFDTSSGEEPYNVEERKAKSLAPYFEKDAKVKVKRTSAVSAKITFDQAKVRSEDYGDIVHSYHIILKEKDGKVISDIKRWSNFHLNPMPKEVSEIFVGVKAGKNYSLSITPINAYGIEGDALETTIKIPMLRSPISSLTRDSFEEEADYITARISKAIDETVQAIKRVIAFK